MKRTNILLEERQVRILDQLATYEGISRAALIRRMIDQALNQQHSNLEADLAAIHESFGALSQSWIDLPVREDGDRQLHLERIRKLAE